MTPIAVSLKTAGEMMELSEDTIARLVDAGELPVIQVGRRRRIPVAALTQWAADRVGTSVATQAVAS